MNYYFVDYENVKVDGFNGINKLTEDDVIMIFYSQNAESLTFGLHRRLCESKAQISYHKVEVGSKNALDFQLVSYLGYILHENKDNSAHFFIITKDNGFTCLANYWNKKGFDVLIVQDMTGQITLKEDDLKTQVKKYIKSKEDIDIAAKYIKQYKTKQGISNALTKYYKDGKKSSEIYKAIKPLLTDKK